MTRFGERLLESAREAVAISEGRLEPARVIEYPEVDVAAIRRQLGLSQTDFADTFGLAVATVRDWEQGRRRPDRTATTLLRVIQKSPKVVAEAVAAQP